MIEYDLEKIKAVIFDVDGVCRGKYLNRDKFISAVKSGFAFCDVRLISILTFSLLFHMKYFKS